MMNKSTKQDIRIVILSMLIDRHYSHIEDRRERVNEFKIEFEDYLSNFDPCQPLGVEKTFDEMQKTISLNPKRPIANKKYQDKIELFFKAPDIFRKCTTQQKLDEYFEDNDVSARLFKKFGLKKLMSFNMSDEDYAIFEINHDLAKKYANDFDMASNFFLNSIHLTRSAFFEIHNYYALSIAHQRDIDNFLMKDYNKQTNKIGADVVIMDLLKIYDLIINNIIKTKSDLENNINIWFSKHKKSEIGKYNIPLFHKTLDLKPLQQELIQDLNNILLRSRYSDIYIGDTII
jgi:hypothetical protein